MQSVMVCPYCRSAQILECIIPGYEVVCDTCWWKGDQDELIPAKKEGDHRPGDRLFGAVN